LKVSSAIKLPDLNDPQKLGSAVTYYRRYTLQSLLSLQAEDDDANTASKAPAPAPKTITNENFAKGVDKVNKGEMFVPELEKALSGYALTKEQQQIINQLKTAK
jgi:hypothetical protein